MNSPVMVIVALVTLIWCRSVNADEAFLSVAPDKCVALRKGQVCYQKLRLRFETPEKGNFCIFSEAQAQPLQCFSGVSAGELIYPFASDRAEGFSLKNADSVILARGEIKIAWVYKKSRKRNRWRLF